MKDNKKDNKDPNHPTTYLIEFDLLSGHTPGTHATLDRSVLQPTGWRSIGNPDGARIVNATGGVIRAIHIEINGGGNSFIITPESAGRLFKAIFVRTDPSGAIVEAFFLGADVPNDDAFWMRVPPSSQREIEQCDKHSVCPFEGQVFPENPPVPEGEGWTELVS